MGEKDVLILGSLPPPFFERFCSRDVEENGEECVLGFVCWRCGRVRDCQLQDGRCIDGAVDDRSIGRKIERFILGGGWWEGDRNWAFGGGFDVAPSWCWGNSRLSKWQGCNILVCQAGLVRLRALLMVVVQHRIMFSVGF